VVKFKKPNGGSFYDAGLKLECLGFVFQKKGSVSYYSRPAGNENEHDEFILGLDWRAMRTLDQRSFV